MLERLRERNAAKAYADWQQRYWDDPLGFVLDCIEWPDSDGPTDYQAEVLQAVAINQRVAVRGPRGLGKTALCAWLVLWWALTRDGENWKILTKANVGEQLTKYLWPEIRLWAHRIKWGPNGVPREPFDERDELMQTTLRLKTGEAFANTSQDINKFEGARAKHLLVLFDEARSIMDMFWRSAVGMFSRGGGRWVAFSTPGEEAGVFYHIHSKAKGWANWWTRAVSLEEAIRGGLVTEDWKQEQLDLALSEDDPFYVQQAMGDFRNADKAGAIIPLVWVEKANQRWEAWDEAGRPGRVTGIGFDVGGGLASGDQSVIAVIYDYNKVGEIVEIRAAADPSTSTMELVGRVVGLANSLGRPPIYGDAQGIGSGVVGRLIEMGYEAYPFVASYGTTLLDAPGVYGFVNWRAAAWWLMREALDPESGQELALPPHDGLTGDLTAPRLKRIDSNARRQVEAKEDLRKRLGRSPDVADAVLHGMIGPVLWAERQQGEQVLYRVKESDYRIGRY